MLFALFGWVNLEVLLLTGNGSVKGQLLTCAFGIFISGTAYRRYRIWWAPLARSAPKSAPRSAFGTSRIASGFGLAAVGFALGYSMRTGFVTTTLIATGILMYLPWYRSSFCRERFFVSQALLIVGGLPILLFGEKYHPLILLADTWVLWAFAAGLILSTLWLQKTAVGHPDKFQAEPAVYKADVH